MTRRATRDGRTWILTVREFDLLEYLASSSGPCRLARDARARRLEGASPSDPIDNVIDVQMARLRKKVDVEGEERLIHTLRGVGFMLREDEP